MISLVELVITIFPVLVIVFVLIFFVHVQKVYRLMHLRNPGYLTPYKNIKTTQLVNDRNKKEWSLLFVTPTVIKSKDLIDAIRVLRVLYAVLLVLIIVMIIFVFTS